MKTESYEMNLDLELKFDSIWFDLIDSIEFDVDVEVDLAQIYFVLFNPGSIALCAPKQVSLVVQRFHLRT